MVSQDPSNAVRVESYEFSALSKHIDDNGKALDMKDNSHYSGLTKSDNFIDTKCCQWLQNGWNTERLLRKTRDIYDAKDLAFSLHWVFPMAYYSVYAVLMAFLNITGYSQSSHSAVIKLFGDCVSKGKYPEKLSFYAKGGKGKIQLCNIRMHDNNSSLRYIPDNQNSVEDQICHFLNATRKADLDVRRKTMRGEFKTRTGKKKNRLSRDDWERVSDSLGYTSILSLLYRKRIKSNYGDIDSYLSNNDRADQLFDNVLNIVDVLNLIHELYCHKALNTRDLKSVLGLATYEYEFVCKRFQLYESILK